MRTFAQPKKAARKPKPGSFVAFGRAVSRSGRGATSVLHPRRTMADQGGLTVTSPEDRFEREADRVADQVMRMPEPDGSARPKDASAISAPTGTGDLIQRLSAHRSPALADTAVLDEEQAEGGTVQTLRSPGRRSGMATVPRQLVSRSQKGMPLRPDVRRFMETRFGADFGRVRVHADNHAAAVSESINARAFTYGPHVYFGNREYRPDTSAGRRVLAHELAHVVQQGAADSGLPVFRHSNRNRPPSSAGIIQRLGRRGRALRHNVIPWPPHKPGGPIGSDYEVKTDAGSVVTAWSGYSPQQKRFTYWCHGHSTGSYLRDDYSVYSGSDFKKVIADEYKSVRPAQTRAGDLAVWTGGFDHSAIFTDPVIQGGSVRASSKLSSKDGQAALAPRTLADLAGTYGAAGIGVFRHK